ncbi:MAG: hypothetical protein MUE99_01535 [Chitinophagaceae bacterium]|jgi:hypothetical protein|nr:hypothetical protein [Chitinophagaceae bacterium]
MYNFTPEDLLQYHYGELEADLIPLIEKALAEDWALHEKYSVIKEASTRLEKSMCSPRSEVMDRIMAYATSKLAQSVEE